LEHRLIMPITINGSGTLTGISTGGLPDGCIATDDLANNAVTTAKMGSGEASGLCKAWVNFNGTGTVAIRASYNVSSITDNGVGDYTVNFTTALADANYSISAMGKATTSGYGQSWSTNVSQSANPTSTAFRIVNSYQDDNNNAVGYVDSDYMFAQVFR
jgi:hypothetical protein